eukprot:TRINITY_DN3003_c0_g1_i6.p1 TRINITY_DN3003_c0_g1~~TRINITY_DN3003_c0_g1_i6.p1  ORF type:complete len:908 (-),score=190.38 TRINITY_DN3003_c0_g1_i6:231-2954(-)
MIVRTYQRRNRSSSACDGLPSSDHREDNEIYGSVNNLQAREFTSWKWKEILEREEAQKKDAEEGRKMTTLMEAQESGEMMEQVDEANFALDGLRPAQPLRIRRASLLSLLSICTSLHQRRLLRTQGMVKRVIDSIVSLSIDDIPTAVSAAALLYVLACDDQDEQFLDSTSCIQFLLKLLLSSFPERKEKAESLGTKLLGMINKSNLSKPSSAIDSGGEAIISEVQTLLLHMKETHGTSNTDEERYYLSSKELNSKWLALLTLEKACLSKISLEDTSASVRQVGGCFKERLRELGGVDAICDVAQNCFTTIKGLLEQEDLDLLATSSMTTAVFQNIGLLLKCLKIMENATFLSEQNQKHLLNMKLNESTSKISFVEFVISTMKVLSDLLARFNSCISNSQREEKSDMTENGDSTSSHHLKLSKSSANEVSSMGTESDWEEVFKDRKRKLSSDSAINGLQGHCKAVHLSGHQKKQLPGNVGIIKSSSKFTSISEVLTGDFENNHTMYSKGFHCSKRISGSATGKAKQLKCTNASSCGTNSAFLGRKSLKQYLSTDDFQDPYEFNDEPPTSWSGKSMHGHKRHKIFTSAVKNSSKINKDMPLASEVDGVINNSETGEEKQGTKQKSSKDLKHLAINVNGNIESSHRECVSGGSLEFTYEDKRFVDNDNNLWIANSSMLGDCLLAGVKVLMNLTNDNPLGCQCVAQCGALDTMASLIIVHYPSFQSQLFAVNKESCPLNDEADNQDLDLLIAILGLLVNLVEKDVGNRARLASSSVNLQYKFEGSSKVRGCRRGVIPLLCSIFLSNQGAGTEVPTGKMISIELNDEASIRQGQREAEHMVVEAYSALLLGFLSTESTNARRAIALCLPNQNLQVLVPVLERFVAFHLSLNMMSSETHAVVSQVIESCKQSL